ncbi:hypothetical protein PHISP_08867, partial [Aspergillus sp. HF37]
AVAGRPHPGPGRTHRDPDPVRDRTPVQGHARTARRRGGHRLHLSPPGRDLRDLRPHHRAARRRI